MLITEELAAMRDNQSVAPSLIMRDPYILDFLGLQDTWQESDLQAAIIREMESFLLERLQQATRRAKLRIDQGHGVNDD